MWKQEECLSEYESQTGNTVYLWSGGVGGCEAGIGVGEEDCTELRHSALVTTSKALVTTSVALVSTSFLLLLVRKKSDEKM